jgi:hypothetical protein
MAVAEAWANGLTGIDPINKLVLIGLSGYVGQGGENHFVAEEWPSIDHLAAWCCLDVNELLDRLDGLEADGLMARTFGGGYSLRGWR